MTCHECRKWRSCPDRVRIMPCRDFKLRTLKPGYKMISIGDSLNGDMNALKREGYDFYKDGSTLVVTGRKENETE